MSWAAAQRADEATKVANAISSRSLRPWRSPSLPQSGVVAAAATTYAVTTHDTSPRLPRSLAITGRPVARIVWSRTAGSIASTIAAKGTVPWDTACMMYSCLTSGSITVATKFLVTVTYP